MTDGIYARKGDEIVDPAGNVYATVARDLSVYQASVPSARDFLFAVRTPEIGEPMPPFLIQWLGSRRNEAISLLPSREPTFKKWNVV